jgi:hypothetical protein
LNPELTHQPHILGKSAVVIAGDIARRMVKNFAGRVCEAMPYARTGPIGQRRTFNLVGARGGAPEKAGGKLGVGQSTRPTLPPSGIGFNFGLRISYCGLQTHQSEIRNPKS